MSKSVLIGGVAGIGLLLARDWALSERLNLLNDLSCTGIPAPNRRNDNAAQRQRAAKKRRKAKGRK